MALGQSPLTPQVDSSIRVVTIHHMDDGVRDRGTETETTPICGPFEGIAAEQELLFKTWVVDIRVLFTCFMRLCIHKGIYPWNRTID